MKRALLLFILFFSITQLSAGVKLNVVNQSGLDFTRVIVFTETELDVEQKIDTLKYSNTLTFDKAKKVTLYFEGNHNIVGICYGVNLAIVKTLKLNNRTMVEVNDHRKCDYYYSSALDDFYRIVYRIVSDSEDYQIASESEEMNSTELSFIFLNKTHYDIYAIHPVVGQTQYGNALFCNPKNRLKQQKAQDITLMYDVNEGLKRKIGDHLKLRFIGVDANSTMQEFCMEVNPHGKSIVISPQNIQLVQRKLPNVGNQSNGVVVDNAAQSANVYEYDEIHQTAKLVEYNEDLGESVIVIPDVVLKDGKEYRITRIGGVRFGESAIRKREFLHLFFSNTLESIEKKTLMDCTLSKVTFGNNLKRIEENAFEDCSGFAELTLPNNSCVVERKAIRLKWGQGIKTLYVPEKADNIPFMAFPYDKEKLKVIVDKKNPYFCVENGIIYSKKKDALYYCPAECSGAFDIPNSVKKIGDAAFYNCNLTSITIPNSVQEIGEGAFYLCEKVSAFEVPNGVKEIKSATFSDCYAVESIVLPSSVTKLGAGVFHKCFKLKQLTLSNGITEIGEESFKFCPIDTLKLPDSLRIVKKGVFYHSRIKHFEFSEGLTEIGYGAFAHSDSLQSVKLPNSLRSIARAAFAECKNLKSVFIADSVSEIQYAAFADCPNLREIRLPGALKTINSSLFEGCSGLTQIQIPGGVEEIKEEVFLKCSSLKRIQLPVSLKSIDRDAFRGCDSLTNITISEQNPNFSFENGLLFNKEKTKLIACLFQQSSYSIPKSVIEIGKEAFLGCDSIESIIIPSSVKRIGSNAFRSCRSLTKVAMSKSVEEIGVGIFDNCAKLTSVQISPNIQVIPEKCFYGCAKLEEVELPKRLKEIGSFAFKKCGIQSIQLPQGLETIEGQAFESCDKLTSVKMPKSVKTLKGTVFSNCKNLQELIVPQTCEIIWEYHIPKTVKVITY